MENKLIVSASPHIRSNASTRRIMLDVILALLPATVAGTVIFGVRSLLVIFSCVASAVLSEFLFDKIAKKPNTVGDFSAVLTGLLLGLNLHAATPVWQCVVGSVFAIVVVKCFFGGLGCNFANPAITARVMMLISFASTGATFAKPVIVDLETGATPLELITKNEISSLPSLRDMTLGLYGGAIGETCVIALLIGFVYLVARRVIHWETPVIFVATVYLLSLAFLGGNFELALYEILSGGLLLGAIFMATDYVTTPITRTGRMLFALGCGVMTVLIRFLGAYPEGVSFAILIMNVFSPYLERWTMKKPLGGQKS